MDGSELLRLAAALVFTLALIGVCAFAARLLFRRLPGVGKGATATRLGVVEWRPLDGRHQLFLLRRDDVEHLVILSPHGAPVVVEQGIRRPVPASPTAPSSGSAVAAGPLSPASPAPLPLGPASRN